MSDYYTSITCTECGVHDLRCVDGLCRNCAWKKECTPTAKALDDGRDVTALCFTHLLELEDVLDLDFLTTDSFLTCDVCGCESRFDTPIRVYIVQGERAVFTPASCTVNVVYCQDNSGYRSAPLGVFASAHDAKVYCDKQNAARSSNQVAKGEQYRFYTMAVQ